MKVSKEFINSAARLAYAAVRGYYAQVSPEQLKPWDQLPAWEKDEQVDCVWYLIENPAAGPDAIHTNWLNYRIAEGWKIGAHFDLHAKKSPMMCTWDELGPVHQAEYGIFREVVLELGRVAGYKAVSEVVRDVASNAEESADA
jgi:hypothetical protein